MPRPAELEGLRVPEVLLSGDHAAIDAWREKEALRATLRKRPDLLETAPLSPRQRERLAELLREEGSGTREPVPETSPDLP